MISWSSMLSLAHLVGLALGLGCATAKLSLLMRCKADHAFVPTYIAVSRPVTRLIILGLVLLTLSGIGWLFAGYSLTRLLFLKLVLVGAIWLLGPVIDNLVEPKFVRLAPADGAPASAEFMKIQRQYLWLETTATGLFYVIVILWLFG